MSNRRTVAMVVNDDVVNLAPSGVLLTIASLLAPTGIGGILDNTGRLSGCFGFGFGFGF